MPIQGVFVGLHFVPRSKPVSVYQMAKDIENVMQLFVWAELVGLVVEYSASEEVHH